MIAPKSSVNATMGVFPCFIYLDLSKQLKDVDAILLNKQRGILAKNKRIMDKLHVSLSDTFHLPYHQVKLFQKDLQELLQSFFPEKSAKKITFGLSLTSLVLFNSSYSSHSTMTSFQERHHGVFEEGPANETNLRKRSFCDEIRLGDEDSNLKDSESETTKSAEWDSKSPQEHSFLCALITNGLSHLTLILKEVNRLITKHLPDYKPTVISQVASNSQKNRSKSKKQSSTFPF